MSSFSSDASTIRIRPTQFPWSKQAAEFVCACMAPGKRWSFVEQQLLEALRQLGRERDELQRQLFQQHNRRYRWLLVGGAASVGLGFAWWSYRKELDFIGKAWTRSARTAFTVLKVSNDYKRTLGPWWDQEKEPTYIADPEYLQARQACNIRSARSLLQLFQRNGGIYIKLGQHLSALEYILPHEFCEVMTVLQDAAPRSSMVDVAQVIQEEFGVKHLDNVYSEFDPEPIGVASLAQVHQAKLKDSNEAVAVKVQHRAIRSYAEVDMFVVSLAVGLVKRIFPEFEFDWLADEMRVNLPKELDFVQEAHNAERVLRNFESVGRCTEWLKVPDIRWRWTTSRVLTMEFCPGAKVTDLQFMHQNGIDPYKVSGRLMHLFSEMIFLHGFVHCDPHPGNILIRLRERGDAGWRIWNWFKKNDFQVVLLDHGLYREISNEFRISYARMWQALISGDVEAIKRHCVDLGAGDAYRLFSSVLTHRTWSSVSVRAISTQSTLKEMELIKERAPGYLIQIADLLAKLPRPLLLLLKSNDLLRGIERTLHEPGDTRPVQSFFLIARYCAEAVLREEQSQESASYIHRLWCYLDYWRAVAQVSAFEALIRLKMYLNGKIAPT